MFNEKSIKTLRFDKQCFFRNSPKLSFADWNKYLDEISNTKKVDANEIKGKLVSCGKPGLSGTTVRKLPLISKISNKECFFLFQSVAKTAALDRLTDASKYGGTHKNRFTPDGKGRGKEGRVDASPARFRE